MTTTPGHDPTRVTDPALARPEIATPGFGQPGELDAFATTPAGSPSDMPTPAARRASRWAVAWMVVVLLVIAAAVILIIVK